MGTPDAIDDAPSVVKSGMHKPGMTSVSPFLCRFLVAFVCFTDSLELCWHPMDADAVSYCSIYPT
jgi:hypothetical protein